MEEVGALAVAKHALNASVGAAEGVSNFLLQTACTCIRSRAGLVQFEAARFARDLARRDGSMELAQLSVRMSSVIRASQKLGGDPFAKIKNFIQDTLMKLEKEAKQDPTKKVFGDQELAEVN